MRANFEKTGIYETDLQMHICKRQVYTHILKATNLILDSPCPTTSVNVFFFNGEVKIRMPNPEKGKTRVTIQENVSLIVIHGVLKPEYEHFIFDRIIQLQTH